MPYQVDDALLHAMSGTELSRVRTELRLLPEPNNQRLLMSRGADIVMQSSLRQSQGTVIVGCHQCYQFSAFSCYLVTCVGTR